MQYDLEVYDYEHVQERDRVNQSLEGFVEVYFANADLDLPDVFPYFDFSLHYENRNVSYKRSQFDINEYNTDTINADIIYQYPFAPITVSSGFLYSIQRYDTNKNLDARRKKSLLILCGILPQRINSI